jgi:hypothetical protein
MYRWLLIAAVVLVAQDYGAPAQAQGLLDRVQVVQTSNKSEIVARRYRGDGDGVFETGEPVLATGTYTTTDGGGEDSIVIRPGNVPANPPIASLSALNFALTDTCSQPPQPVRFYVGRQKGTGIFSCQDRTTSDQRRINRIMADGGSAERMSITFCFTDGCDEKITGAQILLDDGNGTPRIVFLYPTNGGALVQPPPGRQTPIVVNPGGSNSPGIVATFSGGRSTITIAPEVFADWPAFNGFQIGSGSANLQFTFRLADVAMASTAPPRSPDFVDFGCRIDLTQADVPASFQEVVSATNSAKFCPDNNNDALALTCSRQITGLPADEDAATLNTVCKISVLQCGMGGESVRVAQDVKISIDQNGVVTLDCEWTPP